MIMADELTEDQKKNYERAILGIALLFAEDLGIDPKTVDDYSKLTPAQKTFAEKILEKNKTGLKQVAKDKRITEEQIVKIESKAAKQQNFNFARITTYGDGAVCPNCSKWQRKIVCLDGTDSELPSLQDAIDDGFLHFGCRCALQKVDVDEIPLKEQNPRRDDRAKQRPDLYNSKTNKKIVFSGSIFPLFDN